MRFKDAAFGLSVNELSLITHRHPQTIRRYLRTNRAPIEVTHLIDLHRSGKIPSTNESWSGWRVDGPLLIDPDGNGYRPNEIRSLWAVKQLRYELERLRKGPVQMCMDV
ncbi:DUF3653 domain-containing protein [Alcanivorax jadensis]|uniref:DUF3653 domain-containing protein n=1 Tax=Alcanivorax jadensis TaxID=64988 RepID=UPI0009FEE387